MHVNPEDKLRYCWRCRRRIGRGPGPQVCQHCKCYSRRHGSDRDRREVSDLAERVAYYTARAERRLDLFEASPWRRLPGALQRLLEAQTKLAGATCTVAPTDEIE